MRKTKILASIGPASMDKRMMRKMIDAGMNAIRINTAFGNIKQYQKIVDNLRKIKDLPVVLDVKGPEIRIISNKTYKLAKGDKIKIRFNEGKLRFNHKFHVKKGQFILVHDGLDKLQIISANEREIELKSLSNTKISNNLRVNIPGIVYNLPILSQKDIENIKWAIKNKIDYLALSYTRNKEDIKTARAIARGMSIIAKIETNEGIKNFDEILEEADGIMVARGDLGVETPSERLPILQKEIIKKCNNARKLVITATQMLESMINNKLPTRAETSDVANAILDGSDVLMLSGETTIGKYPDLAVKEMAKIAIETEKYCKSNIKLEKNSTIAEAISKSIYEIANILPITKIIAFTKSGYTARIISRFRLNIPIIAITNQNTKKKLELYYGVFPFVLDKNKSIKTLTYLAKKGYIHKNDLILIASGKPGYTNQIEIHKGDEII